MSRRTLARRAPRSRAPPPSCCSFAPAAPAAGGGRSEVVARVVRILSALLGDRDALEGGSATVDPAEAARIVEAEADALGPSR